MQPKLLYDTTVYIDILQGRFPENAHVTLRAADAWHSTLTEAELVAPMGFLDPRHPNTSTAVKQIMATVEHRPAHRTIEPDREVWLVAGILSGLLSRLQSYDAADRRRVLNDALIFETARKHGLTVLTRNISDFDLLQQLEPTGRVLFYDRI
jgi:predicted nucleic acid-binding protein